MQVVFLFLNTYYASDHLLYMYYSYVLLQYINKEKRRRIFNARSKNISLRGTGSKYSMVRVFSRSIDRNQSFFPGCVNIPLFFILVIYMVKG